MGILRFFKTSISTEWTCQTCESGLPPSDLCLSGELEVSSFNIFVKTAAAPVSSPQTKRSSVIIFTLLALIVY